MMTWDTVNNVGIPFEYAGLNGNQQASLTFGDSVANSSRLDFLRGDRSNVQGVVGIVREQSTAVGQGLYLEQLAWLSLSLAIFNLLPFLPLDGGHILFALIERIRRRPLSRELYERVSLIGIAGFVVPFLFVLQQDVGRILDGARPGP